MVKNYEYERKLEEVLNTIKNEQPSGKQLEQLQRQTQALKVVTTHSREYMLALLDTGYFNDAIQGYALLTMNKLKMDDATIKAVINQLAASFESIRAGAAEIYFNQTNIE